MMRNVAWMVWPVVIVSCLAGCSSARYQSYDVKVLEGQRALHAEEHQKAKLCIEEAIEIARKENIDPLQADLLAAEFNLQAGVPEAARSSAEQIIAKHKSPQAHELMGKILLRQGAFDSAHDHLEVARMGYRRAADLQRVDDLAKIVKGLQAYGAGKPQQARDIWGTIKSDQTRAGLTDAIQQTIDGRK